jgi:ribosomal protein S18 acetylase RimI-like enzyme
MTGCPELMNAAIEYAQGAGLRLVLDVMDKDAAAIRLYWRSGWRRIGSTRHHDGEHRVVPAACSVGPTPRTGA